MLLFLIRHAAAQNKSKTGKDFDRSLTKEGEIQAQKLGDYISSLNVIMKHVHVSSSQRTRETAKFALNEMTNIRYDNSLYLPDSKELLKFINELKTNDNLLILGHNEGISSLASYLINQNVRLSTANSVLIEFDCNNTSEISGQTGRLIDFFSPS
jgi:phosphohistidine phosphatase